MKKAYSSSKKKTATSSASSPNCNKKNSNHAVVAGVGRDMVVMLVKEIARSKDETIQAKNQTIDLLMSRKCLSCAGGNADN